MVSFSSIESKAKAARSRGVKSILHLQWLVAGLLVVGRGICRGLIGRAGSFGAMLFKLLVGTMLDATGSYAGPFLVAGSGASSACASSPIDA